MIISLGSDHRGVAAKTGLVELLSKRGHQVMDEGSSGDERVDYPDFAARVAEKVSRGQADRGILVCGSGIGMAIAANKFPGVRASVCESLHSAEMSRRHNDLNVLCLSADQLSEDELESMVRLWLETEFEGGRHQQRLDKISRLEEEWRPRP